jgi:hypothetical protein
MRRVLWLGIALLLVGCGGSGFVTPTPIVPTAPQIAPHTPTPTSRIPFPPTVTVPPPTATVTSAPLAAAPITSSALTPPPIVIPTLVPQAATPTALPPQPIAATTAPAAAQAVSLKNWNVIVVSVERPGQTLKTSSSGTKQALGQWLVIAVDMSNTGKENFGFNSFDFVLKTAAGVSIKEKDDFGFEGDYNRFRGGLDYGTQIPPGVTVHAFIAFDVGPDIAGMKMEFQGNKQLIGLGL